MYWLFAAVSIIDVTTAATAARLIFGKMTGLRIFSRGRVGYFNFFRIDRAAVRMQYIYSRGACGSHAAAGWHVRWVGGGG